MNKTKFNQLNQTYKKILKILFNIPYRKSINYEKIGVQSLEELIHYVTTKYAWRAYQGKID